MVIKMEEKNYEAIIEAILFTMGESVELSRIAAALELPEKDTREILEHMMKKLLPKIMESRSWNWKTLFRCVPKLRCTDI